MTRRLLAHALPVIFGVLAVMTYWFVVANREIVFLYNHDMGPRFPDTGPASLVTRSRYWMSGLVAAGIVLALYTLAALLLGRWQRGYRPPPWRQVWLLCAGLLAAGIPLIMLTRHNPMLTPVDALLTTIFTLTGLAFALAPATLAATAPSRFAWLTIEGLGVAALAQSLTLLEQAWALAQRGNHYGLLVVVLGIGGGAGLLLLTAGVRRWRRQPPATVGAMLAAGVAWGYLLLPAAHHLFFTDGWFYITTLDNFFPSNWRLLATGWLATALWVSLIVRLASASRRRT